MFLSRKIYNLNSPNDTMQLDIENESYSTIYYHAEYSACKNNAIYPSTTIIVMYRYTVPDLSIMLPIVNKTCAFIKRDNSIKRGIKIAGYACARNSSNICRILCLFD